ncbi:MAG: hypothetical protein IT566_05845 [Rhodospirillaceae bacterium]|nr:hypothetical protein [Rhodospirillaceae bacterium]
MPNYCVNKNAQANGDHEVHRDGCSYLPAPANQHYLGNHLTCQSAVLAAKQVYRQSNGCAYCSPACHTS